MAAELTREQRIKEEEKLILKLLHKMEPDRKKSASSLIQNAAFMAITLQDLQKDINENGTTERYQNGANQYGIKKSSSVEIYNVMIKNYSQTMKQIHDLLPKEAKELESDGFDEFVRKRS